MLGLLRKGKKHILHMLPIHALQNKTLFPKHFSSYNLAHSTWNRLMSAENLEPEIRHCRLRVAMSTSIAWGYHEALLLESFSLQHPYRDINQISLDGTVSTSIVVGFLGHIFADESVLTAVFLYQINCSILQLRNQKLLSQDPEIYQVCLFESEFLAAVVVILSQSFDQFNFPAINPLGEQCERGRSGVCEFINLSLTLDE